jgi:Family of unknown function (DUF5991)
MKSKFLFLSLFVSSFMFLVACGGSTNDNSEDNSISNTNNDEVTSDVVENNDVTTLDIVEEYDWEGLCTYEEEAGGDRFYMYSLDVFLADGYYQAFYSIDGYQTMTRLHLYCEAEDDVLYMYFEAYGEEDMFQNGYMLMI